MCRSRSFAARAVGTRRVSPIVSLVVWGWVCAFLVTACAFPGSVKPTVKIGLSAPFEGLYRDLGYEVLHAVRLAVRERNAGVGVGQRYPVEVVALNDYNEADRAVEQARKMAVDPGVMGVLGGWSQETREVTRQYELLGLAFLAPDVDITQLEFVYEADPGFAARYAEQSSGVAPGHAAAWAYTAANQLLDAMEESAILDGHPTRSRVREVMKSLVW